MVYVNEKPILSDDKEFEKLLSSLYDKEWVVYCKPPFKNAACVVEYLGRYTHGWLYLISASLTLTSDNLLWIT